MKNCIAASLIILFFLTASGYAGMFEGLSSGTNPEPKGAPADKSAASGLKEALSIGASNAITSVSKKDGYFSNEMIKIPIPEKIRKATDVLKKAGFQKQVDDFVLSMNRAAEKAAPQAGSIFSKAITEMSIDDAEKILKGGDTAATEYFKSKTFDQLYAAFNPIISSSMNDVGATRAYKEMMGKYESIPFMKKESVDLDNYVTNKALDGIFYMLGQEEKKIRTNPAARVTDLLKTVFGK